MVFFTLRAPMWFIPLEEKNQTKITKKLQMVQDVKHNGSGIKSDRKCVDFRAINAGVICRLEQDFKLTFIAILCD